MRWATKSFGEWNRHFCLLPRRVDEQWVWLEWIEQRFCCDCIEVRFPPPTPS